MPKLVPYFCRVCGHVEWIVEGDSLPDDYACSLCGSRAAAMKPLDDQAIVGQGLQVESVDEGLWCLRKAPRFSREWEHVSYVIAAPDGLILFDPPPIYNESAVDTLQQLGSPSMLILSHSDFVGTAQLWKDRFGLTVMMGMDQPLAGNRVEVDRRVAEAILLEDRLSVFPMPGHSNGSIAMRRVSDTGSQVLLAGDAIAVWDHPNGDTQVCVFEPPGRFGDKTRSELAKLTTTLCCCTGWMKNAEQAAAALLNVEEPSARPYLSEKGGVWTSAETDGWVSLADLEKML